MTVHDLAADWSTWEDARGFRLKGGRVIWEQASYGRSMRRVRIARVEIDGLGIRQINRYVDPDLVAFPVLAQ